MPSVVPPGTVAFGIQLPVQAQSSLFVEPWEKTAGAEEIAAAARAADDAGFLYVAVCDHTAIPRSRVEGMGATWFDTMTTLGFLAAVTRRTRLLSHVYVLPTKHPLAAAKAVATLDVLSGGRAILGVGAGHVAEEFAALGADFGGRGEALDEAIDVVKAALADEHPVHEGRRYSVRDLAVAPRPVQRPRPPIWIGGSSRPALRRAATRGDGWLPQGTRRSEMRAQIAYLLEHRRRALGEVPIEVGAIARPIYVGEPTWDVGTHCVSGTPDRIAHDLRELASLGAHHVQVRFRSRTCAELVDQIQAFGADVAPLVEPSDA